MSAPLANQFWKNRSEHGRKLLFEDPDKLWEAAMKYFNWVDAHPWYSIETNKNAILAKDKLIKVPTVRPYTFSGLAIYLNASENYWHSFRKNKDLSEDFLLIIERIDSIINTQQFEGAAVGAFNANIIARKQGLRENTAVTDGEGKPLVMAPAINITTVSSDAKIAESEEP